MKVPANLAILDRGRSQELLQSFSGIDQWVIGEHSLGTVIACMDIKSNPTNYVGLVLITGYPTNAEYSLPI